MVITAKETVIKNQNALTDTTMKQTTTILRVDNKLSELVNSKILRSPNSFDDIRRIESSKKLSSPVKSSQQEDSHGSYDETEMSTDTEIKKRQSKKFMSTKSKIYPDE